MTVTGASPWRQLGDIPKDFMRSEMMRKKSPMLAEIDGIYAAVAGYSLLYLSQAEHESELATTGEGVNTEDHNCLGNKDHAHGGYMHFASWTEGAAWWKQHVLDPKGPYAATETVAEYVHVYAPKEDGNDEARYIQVICEIANKATGGSSMSDKTKAPKLCFVIVAGHRSDGPGGVVDSDQTEESLTGYCAESDVKALRAAGYDAFYWQRDLDGDNDPTMTTGGGLDRVALGVAAAIRQKTAQYDLVIMIDEHYNGPHSPVHVIVPDTVGLHTAYAGGAPAGDTAANNTLDVQLAAAIAQNAAKNTGMELFHGLLGVPGVMSERETGVAIQYAARLAMFAASSDSQAKCIRLIFEHGGYQDAPAKQNDFTDKCSAAVVAAVKSVFGAPASQPVPDKPKPTPDVPDLWPYAKPLKPSWWDDLISGKKSYVIDHGTIWIRTNNQYRVIRETDRDQTASTNAKDVGPRLPVNTTFGSAAVGQSASNKKGYAMTGMFTRVLLDDLAFVAPDTEGGKAA